MTSDHVACQVNLAVIIKWDLWSRFAQPASLMVLVKVNLEVSTRVAILHEFACHSSHKADNDFWAW